MTTPTNLAQQFEQELITIYKKSKAELGYNPTRFIQMISEDGGVATAHRLINSPQVSDGFAILWENKRLDLSLEYCAIKPEYAKLFTAEEISICKQRLKEYGCKI